MKKYTNYIKEWLDKNNDFNGEYVPSEKDNYDYIGYDKFNNILDVFEEIPLNKIEEYVSLDTLKIMFPIFNEFDITKDWSIHLYKYKNYIILHKSGYFYTFKKK